MKRQVVDIASLIALIILFNVVASLGFISSNIYMWNHLKTEINENAGYQGNGLYLIPSHIEIGFQVWVSHLVYYNGTVVNLGAIPEAIPNYPFILFWISTIGNLFLITLPLVLINKASKQNN